MNTCDMNYTSECQPVSFLFRSQKNCVCGTYARGRASHKDQTAQIRGTFIAEGASSIDQGADTVRLDSAADER